jgi:hypothetical protein
MDWQPSNTASTSRPRDVGRVGDRFDDFRIGNRLLTSDRSEIRAIAVEIHALRLLGCPFTSKYRANLLNGAFDMLLHYTSAKQFRALVRAEEALPRSKRLARKIVRHIQKLQRKLHR